jgi:biotin carboxyl carrier protein
MIYDVTVDGKPHRLELERSGESWRCTIDGQPLAADAVVTGRDVLSLLVEGKVYEVKRERTSHDLHIWVGSARYDVEVRDPRSLRSRKAAGEAAAGPRKLLSPMPGKVVRILAPAGTAVAAGQGVLVVEAMKMQNEIKSPKQGTVQKIAVAEGATVNAGEVLAIVE